MSATLPLPRSGADPQAVAATALDLLADGVLVVAGHHHERWDGAGYPDGLGGRDIPDGARLLALADAWDAMTTDRPYRRALGRDAALAQVDRLAAAQFLPGAGALLRAALAWWEPAA